MPNQDGIPTLALRLIDLFSFALHRLSPWVLAIVGLYLLRDILVALNQESSATAFWVQLMGNVQRTRGFAFLFGGLAIVYGLKQRELRRTAVDRLSHRVTELESLIQRIQAEQGGGALKVPE